MLSSALLFAVMGAFVKLASSGVNSVEIVFFRNFLGLLIIILTFKSFPLEQSGGRPWLLLSRGLLGTLALFAVFYNLAHISLAKTVTFVQTAPIFIALFAALFLKERISKSAWIAVFVGFAGIVLITSPEGFVFSKYDILGIFSGIFAALAYTSIRELKKYYDARIIVLSFLLSGTIVPGIGLLIGSFYENLAFDFLLAPFVLPSGVYWLYLTGVGVSALLGQYFVTKAYSYAKAGIISSVGYSNIAFAALLGYALGDEALDSYTVLGIAIIVVCGVVATREKDA